MHHRILIAATDHSSLHIGPWIIVPILIIIAVIGTPIYVIRDRRRRRSDERTR